MDGNATTLPAYRALLVVDMKNFSGELGRDHAELTESIPVVLRQGFQRCGLLDLWEEAKFQGSTGDGYFLGFSSQSVPYLLNPFLPALQDELDYRNTVSRKVIRMRVSVNVGPMTGPSENTISEGSGDARIETHRLLDSQPVRDLLDRSGVTTCVAGIISARAFEDAVVSGYSGEDPDLYVPAPVQVKSYQGTAYLRVPHPSGDLLREGFRVDGLPESVPACEESARDDAPGDSAVGVRGPVAQGSGRSSTGIGDISGGTNRNVQGDQYGPHYEEPCTTNFSATGDGSIQFTGGHHGDINQTRQGRAEK